MKKIIIILVVIFVYFLSAEKQRIVFCYFGDKVACHNVGYYNETGAENTKINLEKAKKYYEKACRKDFVGSCHNMGLLLNQEKNILAS
ncbi:MAG: sel1 repeat family protein, partial [Campylobacter sp.]|nr:sel1 repeat family protein [Campylobacter sp.]